MIPGQERRRLYSWSRPSKYLPRNYKHESKVQILGTATIAFSPDLEWFQGSITSDTKAYSVYTINGRLRREEEEEEEEQEAELTGLDIASPQLGSSAGSSSSDGDQLTMTPPSEAGSLDSELVREAMESLELEEEELSYKVTIADHVTGTTHALKNVYCSMMSDGCSLKNDDLSFSSSGRFKGAKADMVIQRIIGRSLTKNNMIVFQGSISYTYDDITSYSMESQSPGQWPLRYY